MKQSFFVLLLIFAMCTGAFAIGGTTYTVDTFVDELDGSCADGDCSLRDAVTLANTDNTTLDSIELDLIAADTFTLTMGAIEVTDNMTILLGGSTVDAGGADRAFTILAGNVVLEGVNIVNGGGVASGGCVLFDPATITSELAFKFRSGTMKNCSANYQGAAIHARGNVEILRSAITNNTLTCPDAAVTPMGGSALYLEGDNTTLENVTIAYNDACADADLPETVTGAVYVAPGSGFHAAAATIAHNTAKDDAGGVYVAGHMDTKYSVFLGNTATNTAGADDITVSGTFTDDGLNIGGSVTTGILDGTGSSADNDPATAIGTTLSSDDTLRPLPGGPLFLSMTPIMNNYGSRLDGLDGAISTDQRLLGRPIGNEPELGAVESVGLTSATETADFGDVPVDAVDNVTVTLNATAPVDTVTVASDNASVTVDASACAGSLAQGDTCDIVISFAPTAVGTYTANVRLSANGNDAGGSAEAPARSPMFGLPLGPETPHDEYIVVSGQGFDAAELTLTPSSVDFGDAYLADPVTETVTVETLIDRTVTGITVGGSEAAMFSIESETCTGSLMSAGDTCTVTVAYEPDTVGAAHSGVVSLASEDAGAATIAPTTFPLTGSGVQPPAVTFDSASVDFDLLGEGTADVTLTIPTARTITDVAVSGTHADSFSVTDFDCIGAQAKGATCSVQVAFSPTLDGGLSAALDVTYDAGTQSFTDSLALAGTGGDGDTAGSGSSSSGGCAAGNASGLPVILLLGIALVLFRMRRTA